MMVAWFWHQTMRMASWMEYKVHDDVNGQSCNSHDKHGKRFSYELLVNDSVRSLVNHKDGQKPNDKEITQGSKKFHAMVAEWHFFSGFFLSVVNKEETDCKPDQISYQMKSIWYDRNGSWNETANKLPCNENKGYCNDDVQFTEVCAVILLGRWLVEKPIFPYHRI